ncbi:MAG: M1 family peptidase, partial [Bacteroidia bacterium]|nr:M1 family peptidase [Bacteroidia bacterium]
FQQIIRSYYDVYKGKNADTKDFQAIAEKISGENLDSFFRQWLYASGIPKVLIMWKYPVDEKKLVVTVEQMQNTDPFHFPLDISIVLEPDKSRIEKLTISKKKETFTFDVKNHPIEIIADPYISLLFEGSVYELK